MSDLFSSVDAPESAFKDPRHSQRDLIDDIAHRISGSRRAFIGAGAATILTVSGIRTPASAEEKPGAGPSAAPAGSGTSSYDERFRRITAEAGARLLHIRAPAN